MTENDIEVYEPQSSDLTIGRTATAVDDWYDPFPKIIKLAEYVASTEFVPDAMRNRPAAVAAAILTGREMGLPPMVSLRHLYVVRGRVGQSAELMRAQIYRAGHELKVIESTDARCVLEGRRDGETEMTRVQFTIEDARKNSIDVRYYTADKLFARATTRLARRKFPDAVMGLPTVDELEDGATPAEVIELTEAPPIKRARATRKPKAANTQPPAAPAPAEPAEPDAADAELADLMGSYTVEVREGHPVPGSVKPVTRPSKRPAPTPPAEPEQPPAAEPEPAPPAPAESPEPPKRRKRGRPTKAEAEARRIAIDQQLAEERAAVIEARERAKAEAAAADPRTLTEDQLTQLQKRGDTRTTRAKPADDDPPPPEQGPRLSPATLPPEPTTGDIYHDPLGAYEQPEQGAFADIPEEPLSPQQRTTVIMTLREIGITSHEDRTIIAGEIIGHPIDSTNELTRSEATRVIDTVNRWQVEGTADTAITSALNTWALRQVDRDE